MKPEDDNVNSPETTENIVSEPIYLQTHLPEDAEKILILLGNMDTKAR